MCCSIATLMPSISLYFQVDTLEKEPLINYAKSCISPDMTNDCDSDVILKLVSPMVCVYSPLQCIVSACKMDFLFL